MFYDTISQLQEEEKYFFYRGFGELAREVHNLAQGTTSDAH